MEPRNYLRDTYLFDTLSEDAEPLKLTTINNDCKELIFDYLEWPDLINIADSSKQLYSAVCRVFYRKYSNAKIDFISMACDRFKTRNKFVIPDIWVMNGGTMLKMLRNFGHLIVNVNIDYMARSDLQYAFNDYLAEYSSQSLVQLSLYASRHAFQNTQKPFTNLKSLYMDACTLERDFSFNRVFPNLQSLKFANYNYQYPSAIKMHFISLTDLSFYDAWSFDQNDIDELLQLNPQLEKLDLRISEGFCAQFIQRLKKYCPNLKHLGLGCPYEVLYTAEFEPTHLDQIEKLTLNDIYDMSVPLTFSKLKYLQIGGSYAYTKIYPHSVDISVFIGKNPHLKSLKVELFNIELSHFFRIESLLMNIEELSIGILKEDIPSDDLIHFLAQNRSLKRFSLTGRFENFYQFYNAIISRDAEFKIRNNAIEFIVKRTTDHSLIKYVLRNGSLGTLYEGHLLECCTYNESPHLMSQKYDAYINAILNKHDNYYGLKGLNVYY